MLQSLSVLGAGHGHARVSEASGSGLAQGRACDVLAGAHDAFHGHDAHGPKFSGVLCIVTFYIVSIQGL
jgi:hypothetical protein